MKDYARILIAVLTHCFATVVSCPRLLMTSAVSFSSELRPQTTSRRGTGVITARYFPNLLPRIALTAMVLLCLGVAVSAEAAVFNLNQSWRATDQPTALMDGSEQDITNKNGAKFLNGYTYIKICVVSGSDSYRQPDNTNIAVQSFPSLDTVVGKVRDALRRSWEEHSSIRFIGWEYCANLSDDQKKEYVGFYTHSDVGNYSGGGPRLKGKTDPAHWETVLDDKGNPVKDEDGKDKQQLAGPGGPQFAPFGLLNPCYEYDSAHARYRYKFDCAREYAIHEFGHAIGFQHESPLHPKGHEVNCGKPEQAVLETDITKDPTTFAKGKYFIPNKDYDFDSIMTYNDDCAHVTGTRFGSPIPDQFDLQAVQMAYPPLPPSEFDVGVIPDSLAACPAEKRVTVYLDNEDNGQGNTRSGWTGAIRSDRNTRLEFCRADGTKFGRHQPSEGHTSDYAVLKLGTTCPNGSLEVVREFDDENDLYNENWMGGDLGQNRQFGDTESRTFLHFCWFQGNGSDGPAMPSFPQLGFNYGVIGQVYNAVQSGFITTDDENDSNHNSFKNQYGSDLSPEKLNALSSMIAGDINTRIALSLVRLEHAPTVSERSFTADGIAEGNLLDTANDPDGDTLTVEVQAEDPKNPGNYLRPDHGTLDLDLLQKGRMLYTPDPGFTGTDVFTFQVTDGVHRSNLAAVAIVTPPAPVLTIMLVAQPETSLSFRSSNGASFTLANRQRQDFTFRAKEAAVVTAAVPTGWYLSRIFCPGDPQAGIDLGTGKLQVQLHAGQHLSCIYELGQTGSLAVFLYRDRNANGQYEQARDTPLTGWSVQLYGQSYGDSVLLNEQRTDAQGKVSFTALPQRTYKVCAVLKPKWRSSDPADTAGQSCKTLLLEATALTRGIQLGLVNDEHAPVVADRTFVADGTAQGNLLSDASDQDGDSLTLALQPENPTLPGNYLKPSHGQLNVTGTGDLVYTPTPGFTGTDSFSFQVTDGEMRSNVATARVWTPPAPVVTIVLDASPTKAMSFRSSTGTTFTLATGQRLGLTFQAKTDAVVTAAIPAGWYLANIACSDNSGANTDPVAGKVQISVHAAQRLSCTYQLRQYGSLEGLLYHDRNSNGIYDNQGDTRLVGWSVQLFNADNGLLDEKTTDVQGKVRFASVPQGQYKLCEVLKQGWRTSGSGFVGGQSCKPVNVSGGLQPQMRFGNITP